MSSYTKYYTVNCQYCRRFLRNDFTGSHQPGIQKGNCFGSSGYKDGEMLNIQTLQKARAEAEKNNKKVVIGKELTRVRTDS